LRTRVANEAASLMLHLGAHAPPLDEYAQPLVTLSVDLYFRSASGDVLAVRDDMAFWWSSVTMAALPSTAIISAGA
jgi:hypothetical protein